MHDHPEANHAQAALWNGRSGRAWIDAQAVLDRLFKPFEDRLAEAARRGAWGRVLDVGCGTGGTTIALARQLGAGSRCTGIDISAPMIAIARSRAARDGAMADFVCGDAQTHALPPAAFDAIVSRFGVMFFERPAVAFANLRRAAREGAVLHLFAWRGAAENPFMTTAERAAAPLLPGLPPRRPDGPGQFSFADRDRVAALLEAGGWQEVEVQALDVPCVLPEPELVDYFTRLGPVGGFLQEADASTRTRVVETVRPAFDPYVQGAEVRFTAACWLITGRTGAAPAPGEEAGRA